MAPEEEDTREPAGDGGDGSTRVRKRTRKRHGPPQLQFLTATNLSQFKDENAKRSVRSQAMIQYRYKADQQKKRTKGKEPAAESSATGQVLPVAERVTPVMADNRPYQRFESPLMSEVLGVSQEEQHLYPSTSAAWCATNESFDEGFGEPSWSYSRNAVMPANPSSRYHRVLAALSLDEMPRKVHDYEETDGHENAMMRMIIAKLAMANPIGDGVDPFSVLPQFKSPELNALYLTRKCNRAFVSPATIVKWLPSMLAHPHILLSSTLLASTYLDMHAGCSGDSKRTVLVKAETIGWINDRLRHPEQQFEDFTLMVILHLLAGEMWSCNEKTLQIHQSGVVRLICARGGMDKLGGGGAMAEVAAACCLHTDIFCEATPQPLFQKWEAPTFSPVGPNDAIPESPLFCPRSEFVTIARNSQCSEVTYDLLCDMRDLTDAFISYNKGFEIVLDVEAEEDTSHVVLSATEYEAKVTAIRKRLASLPSAYTPGLPTTNDWVYESCRIASIIYASAIIMRVPFSVASEPGRSVILADSVSLTNSLAGGHLASTRLTEALYEVLERTNMQNVWAEMSGVLYWVSLVAAAAARTPVSINMTRAPRSRSEAYATWVRRCLIMFATRTMIVLVFQHPLPIIMAQRRLLKVQELIGTGSSRHLS